MTKVLRGKIFELNEKLMYAAGNYIADFPRSYFLLHNTVEEKL